MVVNNGVERALLGTTRSVAMVMVMTTLSITVDEREQQVRELDCVRTCLPKCRHGQPSDSSQMAPQQVGARRVELG